MRRRLTGGLLLADIIFKCITAQARYAPLTQPLSVPFYSEQVDTFANKYIADYSSPRPAHFTGHLLKEQIESEIESLNSILATILPDRLRLGDFFSTELAEVEKTLEVYPAPHADCARCSASGSETSRPRTRATRTRGRRTSKRDSWASNWRNCSAS